jgi:hypothetical protein
MAKKSKANHAEPDGMWIAPRHSTNTQKGDSDGNRLGGVPPNSRYLELAAIALGVKKPTHGKKKAAAASANSSQPPKNKS